MSCSDTFLPLLGLPSADRGVCPPARPFEHYELPCSCWAGEAGRHQSTGLCWSMVNHGMSGPGRGAVGQRGLSGGLSMWVQGVRDDDIVQLGREEKGLSGWKGFCPAPLGIGHGAPHSSAQLSCPRSPSASCLERLHLHCPARQRGSHLRHCGHADGLWGPGSAHESHRQW